MTVPPPQAPTCAEAQRLALVRRLGLIDTPPDERFDVFTRLAAGVAGTPVSIISLIDEHRVWFASSRGLPAGFVEVPRDIAACAHVLDSMESVLVIPDARRDPRVAESPLVTGEFGMRFYAGAKLRAPGGEVLGALCVVDREPRQAEPAMVRALEDLAAGVSVALRVHEMAELALKDPLTGLGNRRMFEEALDGALAGSAGRDGTGRAVGVVLLDLDRFREVNETLGHAGGDATLRAVGQRIALGVRDSDVAARLDGDLFALLAILPDSPGAGTAFARLAERILAGLRETPLRVEGQGLGLRASAGIAFASRLAPGAVVGEPGALLRAADAALHAAKRGGGDRAVLRGPGPAAPGIGSKVLLAADLRAALAAGAGGGLSLVLQPLRAVAEAGPAPAILGFEALLRWTHPERGPIPPGDFVPVAERTGLAAALDGWVLHEACRIAARFPPPWPRIAVNVTPSFLAGPDFLPMLDAALAASRLPPSCLSVEVTERVLPGDLGPVAAAVEGLHARGVAVALDDFGAGHASLAYLAEVAFTRLKIDRSLVAALGHGDRAATILRGIIGMARGLGLTVVAEGVETAEQLRLLRGFGCDEAQGWHLGRPAPAEWWIEALRTRAERLAASA